MAANARGANRDSTITGATERPALSIPQQRARQLYRFLTAAFVIGLVLQIFIVGVALFVDSGRWDIHQRLGHALTLVPVLMLVLALVGRMTTRTRVLTIVPIALAILQMITAIVGGWTGSIHPLNALLLISIGLHLFQRTSGTSPDSARNETSEARRRLNDSGS